MGIYSKKIGFAAAAAVLTVILFSVSCGKKTECKKWEYKTVNIEFKNPRDIEPFLNEYGKGGWELINMSADMYVFKRQRI